MLRVLVAALVLGGCASEARIRLLDPASLLEPDSGPPDSGPPVQDSGSTPATPPELILRYDFSGTGTVVEDRVGSADAQLIGGVTLMPDRDFILLDGVDDYVDMPNGLISGLRSATIVAWVAWNGGPCWQRVFDFGASDAGEGEMGNATSSLFMTPAACGGNGYLVMAEVRNQQYGISEAAALMPGYTFQVALVVDADRGTFSLYRDTMLVAEDLAPFTLSEIDDINAWLGRSQWIQDAYFDGIIGEFRIYSGALPGSEIARLYALGPNAI